MAVTKFVLNFIYFDQEAFFPSPLGYNAHLACNLVNSSYTVQLYMLCYANAVCIVQHIQLNCETVKLAMFSVISRRNDK